MKKKHLFIKKSGIAVALSIVMAFTSLVPLQAADLLKVTEVKEVTESETPVEADQDSKDSESMVSGEILVVYDDAGLSRKETKEVQKETKEALDDLDIQVTEEVSACSEKQGTVVVAEIPEHLEEEVAVELAMEEAEVAYAQPNYVYESLEMEEPEESKTEESKTKDSVVNDPYVLDGSAYYLEQAGITEAWEVSKSEKAVTVAVLDTGCRMDHEDLKENLLPLAYDVIKDQPLESVSNQDGGNTGEDAGDDVQEIHDTGHGTHVCGLVAAQAGNGKGIAGTSYNAQILPVKIFDDNTNLTDTKSVYEGLKYCQKLIDEEKVTNLHVINMSMGAYRDSFSGVDLLLKEQIERMTYEYNVLCVCAGGNGDFGVASTDGLYPSDFDASFSVTALDRNGNNCSWSDYNMDKDISAPGEAILSTYSTQANAYCVKSGTSMAAPIVSGISALLWAKYPDLTVSEVKAALLSTADPVESNATDGREGKTGSVGAVNAKAALTYIENNKDNFEKRLEDGNVTLEETAYTYTRKETTPQVIVNYYGDTLKEGEDYTVSYSNNINAGTAKVVVQGIRQYTGTVTKEFSIAQEKISKCTYSLSFKTSPYTGKEIKPSVRLYFNKKEITQGVDYTVRYSNNINAGTARVYVTGCGKNFTGTGYFKFTITRADMKTAKSSLARIEYRYNGKAKKPSVKITYGNQTLAKGKDYTISYAKNVRVGTARAVIKAAGENYTGSVTKTFKICPRGTKLTKLTRGSDYLTVAWKKQCTQTDGYQIQYGTDKTFKNATKKTVKKNTTTCTKISKIKRNKTYYVRIRTYKTVDGKKYYSAWSEAKRHK